MKTTSSLIYFFLFTFFNSSQIGAQVQQFISSNGSAPVSAYNAEICTGNDVTLEINDLDDPTKMWTWYGPNNFYSSGNTIYISHFDANFSGIFEAVSDQGDFYHFELFEKDPEFIEFKREYVILSGNSYKIWSPKYNKPGYTYYWSTGETTNHIVVNPEITTSYSVTVTTEFGCSDSSTKTIYVGNEANYFSENRIVCKRGNYYLEGPENYAYYEWITIPTNNTSKDIVIRPKHIKNVQLMATKENGQVDYYSFELSKYDCLIGGDLDIASPNENKIEPKLMIDFKEMSNIKYKNESLDSFSKLDPVIYPNPCKDFIKVDFNRINPNVKCDFYIADNMNQIIYKTKKTKQTLSINTSMFPPGQYYLIAQEKEKIFSKKFTVL